MILLEPGTLWNRVVERTALALERGALQRIHTTRELIEDRGVSFLVRHPPDISRPLPAPRARRPVAERANPFLPYEQPLFVVDLSPTHVCLLNKFNVIDHHLLIVTREFERQTDPLGLRDFEAMWCCMAEFDALAFYNAGSTAGASQPHRHLQIVPVPLVRGPERMPMDRLLTGAELAPGIIGTAPGLPFAHALARSDDLCRMPPAEAAAATVALYAQMRRRLLPGAEAAPYNLLVTRRWMWMVPRQRQSFQSIEINALGFAGTFFARSPEQLERLRALRPLSVLSEVAGRARSAL